MTPPGALYDRLVARIVLDGRDSSLELVEAGLACHFTRIENDPVLAKAQLTARTAGRGFWAAGAAKPACVKFTYLPDHARPDDDARAGTRVGSVKK